MKIAIIGKAGSGKTTVAHLFSFAGLKVYNCDDIVHEEYNKHGAVYYYLKRQCPSCIINGKIDRDKLSEILVNNDVGRLLLEQFFYSEVFERLLRNQDNFVVDGLMPEYVIGDLLQSIKFDMVLYAYVDKNTRHERLIKRGMSEKRFKQINKIQSKWRKTLSQIIK
jgi:dephospho-CoA kinase